MDRRDFFKILSASSAGVLTTACNHKPDKLIPLLVPEHEIVPGEEQWHPAVCTECSAGCATLVRVMEGIRTVERNGESVRERIAAVKKIEGNPLDPVSGGRLCARGQASVQSLYHPDRLRGPLRRTGSRGQAKFVPISWDEAIASAAERILETRKARSHAVVFLSAPSVGTRSLAIQRFTKALGIPAPLPCSVGECFVERKAAEVVFGWKGVPTYDIARANHVLGVGADFLGGWASPVYYARQYGHFRQGRRDVRGRLVQAESRLSLTAAAADKWLPLQPGSEPQFLGAVGRILLDLNLARAPQSVPKPIIEAFRSVDPQSALATCGLDPRRVHETVQEFGESEAPLVLAGAGIPHTNSVDAVVASHYLNVLLANVGKPSGLLPPATESPAAENQSIVQALAQAEVVLIDSINPAYTLPLSSGICEALARAQTVISFASFADDTAAWADLLLPDHHPLEAELARVPVVAPRPAINVALPFVAPLYETRPVEKTLADLALKINVTYAAVTAKDMVAPNLPAGLAYDDVARQGGLWLDAAENPPVHPSTAAPQFRRAAFAGDPRQYPLLFQPYYSLQFHDGRSSHVPWLQELPDPASSAMWGLPVEIDPPTAARLHISNGDIVRVESPNGNLQAPAYVNPAAVPQVISMAIGGGHSSYGRYASGRGANPLSILAPVWESSSGALVLGGTRVRLSRVGPSKNLIQFSSRDRETEGFDYR